MNTAFVRCKLVARPDVVTYPQDIAHLDGEPGLLADLAAQALVQRLAVLLAAAGQQEELTVGVIRVEVASQQDVSIGDDDGFGGDANWGTGHTRGA